LVSNGKILTASIYTKDCITEYTFSTKAHKACVTDKREQNLSENAICSIDNIENYPF